MQMSETQLIRGRPPRPRLALSTSDCLQLGGKASAGNISRAGFEIIVRPRIRIVGLAVAGRRHPAGSGGHLAEHLASRSGTEPGAGGSLDRATASQAQRMSDPGPSTAKHRLLRRGVIRVRVGANGVCVPCPCKFLFIATLGRLEAGDLPYCSASWVGRVMHRSQTGLRSVLRTRYEPGPPSNTVDSRELGR